MPELPGPLQEKINSAQTVNGVSPAESLVPHRSIHALLEDQVDRYEQKPFLVFYSDEGYRKEYSYREFYEEVCKTANLLRRFGITRGDRVASVSFNHADVVIQYFAAFLLGAVVVPINIGDDDRRISFILKNAGVKVAFVRDEFLERAKQLRTTAGPLNVIIQVGKKVDPSLPHLESELVKIDARFKAEQRPERTDEALIVYTSGTTGMPRAVVLTQYNLLVDAMAIAEWNRIADDQRMMCVLPLHHVNGIVVTLMAPLYCGAGIVLNQRFHPERFFERISIEKVSVVSVVPTILQFLLHAKLSMDAYKLAHFRHIICGAGPLTVELAMKFEQEFKIPVIHGYGLSETTCYSSLLPIDLPVQEHRQWMSKYGFPSIGVPLPVNEMSIHDDHGNEMAEGAKGEIVIRGHTVMKHYAQDPEVNEKTFTHGWFRSGDEGFFRYDEQGRKFFFITGRMKEIIIRGGVNISPYEIDEVLMKLPGVQLGFAVGFENDWYGEEVGAYVTMKENMEVSEHDVITHCRRQLPFTKSPKVVLFGTGIAVTSTGKYQRSACKELFVQWKTVQFTEKK